MSLCSPCRITSLPASVQIIPSNGKPRVATSSPSMQYSLFIAPQIITTNKPAVSGTSSKKRVRFRPRIHFAGTWKWWPSFSPQKGKFVENEQRLWQPRRHMACSQMLTKRFRTTNRLFIVTGWCFMDHAMATQRACAGPGPGAGSSLRHEARSRNHYMWVDQLMSKQLIIWVFE